MIGDTYLLTKVTMMWKNGMRVESVVKRRSIK